MTRDKILITGSAVGNAPRLEINDFIKNKKQLSLYLQALQTMFLGGEDERLSWFKIAAIHGRPFEDWNGSPNLGNSYCVHATNVFPTWHRPYVALLEQILHGHAVKIAEQYTVDCDEWKSAAADLRQPYWDWVSNSTPPDAIICDETITIPLPPQGCEEKVVNPFIRYRFKKGERDSFLEPVTDWKQTIRHPTTTGEDATSDVQKLKKQLADVQEELRYDTLRLFSITDWEEFSTTGLSEGTTNSLEGIHNSIHFNVGGRFNGSGHMGHIEYAAFDPIFFLLHCQVDHLISQWHAIHGAWVPDSNVHKDLTPFWRSQSSYWNSSEIKDTTSLNYTYADLSKEATPSVISLSMSKLYAGSSFDPVSRLQTLQPSHATNTIIEWTARIRSKQYELGGSFSVLLFLGTVPQDPEEWFGSPTFVGSFDALVNCTPEECSNCRANEDIKISGFVHLNAAILSHYDQGSLQRNFVVPRLTRDLSWRVLKLDGIVAELPSLEVVVMATPLTLPTRANLPNAGRPELYPDITRGKPGGSRAPS